MNKIKLALIVSMFAAPALAHEGRDHDAAKTAAKVQAVQGEMLDMACYMNNEEKGAKHAKCAEMCVKGGSPLGLLTKDGKVYLLVNDHENEKAFAEAKLLAGANATVTGKVVSRGGVQAIIVGKAERL
jgi:hypothetical protein